MLSDFLFLALKFHQKEGNRATMAQVLGSWHTGIDCHQATSVGSLAAGSGSCLMFYAGFVNWLLSSFTGLTFFLLDRLWGGILEKLHQASRLRVPFGRLK